MDLHLCLKLSVRISSYFDPKVPLSSTGNLSPRAKNFCIHLTMSWSHVPGDLRAVDVTVNMTHSLVSFLSMFTYLYGKWHFTKGIYTKYLVASHENYISSLSIISLKCKMRTLASMPAQIPSSSKTPWSPCHVHQARAKGNLTFPFFPQLFHS